MQLSNMNHHNEEQQIVEQLCQGSIKAFDGLYNKYSPKLYAFILKISNGNTYIAEEITQKVFVKIWELRQQVDPSKNFLNFIFTIGKNMLLQHYQHETVKYVYREHYLNANSESDNHTEAQLEFNSLNEQLDKIIEQLPPGRKKVLILSRKEFLPNKKIAEALNISESTVEKQLANALKFVRDKLSKVNKTLLLAWAMLINTNV